MSTGICGLVLAGGQGRRMGGVDKGLQLLQGRPLMQHVLDRLRPQVDSLLINANQNLERYAQFGCPVVPDRVGGFAGPLAGLDAGLHATDAPMIVTAPCDSPFLPRDLVARLHAAGYALHGPAPGVLPAGSWGYVYLPAAVALALASVLTAPLGTRLAHRISGQALKRLFAVFLALVGTSLAAGGGTV